MKRAVVVLGLAATVLLVPAVAAIAHPLGNFTVNRYAGIRIGATEVRIDYVIDMAEIPTYQERTKIDLNADGRIDEAERVQYAADACALNARNLGLAIDGSRLTLAIRSSTLAFLPGAAGLQTLRLGCDLAASTPKARSTSALTFTDSNDTGRVGWREITAQGDGTTLLQSDVPQASVSAELTRYPQDLLQSPLAVRSATARFRPGGAAAAATGVTMPALLPRGVDQATRAFTSFLSRRHLTLPLGAFAVLLAVLLGAVHALAPGHGKTVMAAYLVGQKGTARQGALIGLTVTATHTAGVLVLGVLVSASTKLAPEHLYPLLGIASGLMLCAVGSGLFRRAIHHRHDHVHGDEQPLVGRKGLIGMGFAGGLVPSPSALVVLLGAIALKRMWFGVGLVVAYGAGMAVTLCTAGLILVKMRAAIERRSAGRNRGATLARLARALPVLTGSLIVGAGLMLAVRGATQI